MWGAYSCKSEKIGGVLMFILLRSDFLNPEKLADHPLEVITPVGGDLLYAEITYQDGLFKIKDFVEPYPRSTVVRGIGLETSSYGAIPGDEVTLQSAMNQVLIRHGLERRIKDSFYFAIAESVQEFMDKYLDPNGCNAYIRVNEGLSRELIEEFIRLPR